MNDKDVCRPNFAWVNKC